MYHLFNALSQVKGIGPNLAQTLAQRQLFTVKDILCFLPLRYEDRSQRVTISQLQPKQLVTFSATVVSSNNYYKGRRSIQSAVVKDETGRVKLMWFNNHYILNKLVTGRSYLFSGQLNDRGVIVQPVVEGHKEITLHTDRLVPIYSHLPEIKQGNLRRILSEILEHLDTIPDPVSTLLGSEQLDLQTSLHQLHFPDEANKVIKARERLALEELLSLMRRSQEIKQAWHNQATARQLTLAAVPKPSTISYMDLSVATYIPDTVPFQLTQGQLKATQDIFADLQLATPMNRLLVGDVGSGKTVVAGLAAWQTIANGYSAVLVAPTRILAEQHLTTIQRLFPDLNCQLITSQTKTPAHDQPSFFIGTHAVLKHLPKIKPALLIYDEQHRFGVNQRSQNIGAEHAPHILTMSATPIPRSLMLTIFAHLSLSTIDELPAGRLPTKTWVVPKAKRDNAFTWIADQLAINQAGKTQNQAIVVCPFIDPSNTAALENVAAVNDTYNTLHNFYAQQTTSYQPRIGLLHSKLKKVEQASVIEQLYKGEIDLLVTTPIVEVGVDLPKASIIVIEAADRFGLASLHQLRGRVGRAGQQGYCLLFSTDKSSERLEKFSLLHKGSQIAELDLEYRGAGDIFGTQQHGFDQLQFASWANVTLISQARQAFTQLGDSYQPLFYQGQSAKVENAPLAN